MYDIFITIIDKTDSRALYEELKPYNLNVTDLGSTTYVYGRVATEAMFDNILAICEKYGTVED